MIGYKAFNEDLTCRDFQYEVGKTYVLDEQPIICKKGFHFCKTVADCYKYYPISEKTRICKVSATGKIVADEEKTKFCTNKIKIIKEIKDDCILKGNISSTSTGYFNTGNYNTGDYNTGVFNTGVFNTGDYNAGDCNTGHYNTGDFNTGSCNTGDLNTMNGNAGHHNSGRNNVGNYNTGDFNEGYYNTGDCNTGHYNTGNHNKGYRNVGDWNSGDWNTGVFCTTSNKKIKMFNKESNWTIDKWHGSKAFKIMSNCPTTNLDFINEDNMTAKEKKQHPEYKTMHGFLKTIKVTNKDRQKWWDGLDPEDRKAVCFLPNFDAKIFRRITGIKVNTKEK